MTDKETLQVYSSRLQALETQVLALKADRDYWKNLAEQGGTSVFTEEEEAKLKALSALISGYDASSITISGNITSTGTIQAQVFNDAD